MRRMISFTPVAHGELDIENNRFVLDQPLEKNSYFLVHFENEIGYWHDYIMSTIGATAESPIFPGFLEEVYLTWDDINPNYIQVSSLEEIDEGSTIEVIKVA